MRAYCLQSRRATVLPHVLTIWAGSPACPKAEQGQSWPWTGRVHGLLQGPDKLTLPLSQPPATEILGPFLFVPFLSFMKSAFSLSHLYLSHPRLAAINNLPWEKRWVRPASKPNFSLFLYFPTSYFLLHLLGYACVCVWARVLGCMCRGQR